MLSLLAVVWLFVLTLVSTFGQAIFHTSIGLGIPLLLILSSGYLATMTHAKVSLEEIDPMAIIIFAWVYVVGANIWFVYRVFGQ